MPGLTIMGKGSQNAWLQRQRRDVYVKKAKQDRYRSRAVYKLIEIDDRDHLFKPAQTVIDLGAAPGSWCQYVSSKIGRDGRLLAVDLMPMEPIDNVLSIVGDFTEQSVYDRCLQGMNGGKADVVLSDMAPNLSGIRARDQGLSIYLAELSLELARAVLKKGGDMLVKVFAGEGTDLYQGQLRALFRSSVVRKPDPSRDGSREFYVLSRDLL